MTFLSNATSKSITNFAARSLAIVLVFAGGAISLPAQSATSSARPAATAIKTFYLTNSNEADARDIVTALRNELTAESKIYLVVNENALVVETTPDQLQLAQRLLQEVDRPKKTYRLTYTITELDANKRVGTQHFNLVIVSGQRTTLKQGSKVPIATGTYTAGSASSQTQFTYLDVGINIDATIDESSTGIRLKSKVEQSSIADSSVIADIKEPIIRQSVIEGISLLSLSKPLVLGGIDVPGSTRHFDIEAVAEVVK